MFPVILILGIVTFLLGALHWYQTRSRFAFLLNQFPMLPCKPLIGHVADYSSNPEKLFIQIRKTTKMFKETFGIWSAYHAGISIVTHDDAEIILTNVNYIKKGIVYHMIEPWLGECILTSDGEKWQHRRKLLTPTFHFNILRRFVEVFGEHSIELINVLKNETKKKETDIIPIITNTTLSAICETAMGTNLDFNDKKHIKYLDAMIGVINTVVRRIFNPLLYTNFALAISPLGFLQRRYIKTLHEFSTTIINEREKNFKDSDVLNSGNNNKDEGIKKKYLAMLDLLLSAKNRGEIDFQGVQQEVDAFMFGGHDTIAISIIMALMLLAHHKDVQEKIMKEVDEIFGDDDRPASYDDLMKMKYLELCIKESLRLYPSAPIITRNLPEEVKLTHNTAPAGCEIFIHIYDIHRNEEIFPDPEKFDPDRFLPENCKGRPPYAYIPFSAGPRNCLGQKFALLEMKSFISAIFRNFTLEPVTKFEEIRWAVDLVLRPNNSINVKFISRK